MVSILSFVLAESLLLSFEYTTIGSKKYRIALSRLRVSSLYVFNLVDTCMITYRSRTSMQILYNEKIRKRIPFSFGLSTLKDLRRKYFKIFITAIGQRFLILIALFRQNPETIYLICLLKIHV